MFPVTIRRFVALNCYSLCVSHDTEIWYHLGLATDKINEDHDVFYDAVNMNYICACDENMMESYLPIHLR